MKINNKIKLSIIIPVYNEEQIIGQVIDGLKKELKQRYPKHVWPEDPWTEQAIRGVKRKS